MRYASERVEFKSEILRCEKYYELLMSKVQLY